MKILYKALSKVGRVCFPVDDLNINKRMSIDDGLCYYDTITLDVNYFAYTWKGMPWEEFIAIEAGWRLTRSSCYSPYNWEGLRDSIAKEGLRNNFMVILDPARTGDFEYRLVDGQHRLRCLEELHGIDCRVLADVYVPFDYIDIIKLVDKNQTTLNIDRGQTINDKTY